MEDKDRDLMFSIVTNKWRMGEPLTTNEFNFWVLQVSQNPPKIHQAGPGEFLGLMDSFAGILEQMKNNIQTQVKQMQSGG